jgi:hypothetical protein
MLKIVPLVSFLHKPKTLAVFFIGLLYASASLAQSSAGILKGRVRDIQSGLFLYGVIVSTDSLSKDSSRTMADGSYSIKLSKKTQTIRFSSPGFETKTVLVSTDRFRSVNFLDIFLLPEANSTGDSSGTPAGPVARSSVIRESYLSEHPRYLATETDRFSINEISLQGANDFNTTQVLKRMTGIIVSENPKEQNTSRSMSIFGMGERYSQVLLDGALMSSIDAGKNAYPFEIIPAEMISGVEVSRTGLASAPASFAGGMVNIKTKDIPDRNFFYVQLGGGLSDASADKEFLGDKKGDLEFLGFPGAVRDLPSVFPTSRSKSLLNQKNPQEQVYLSRLLNNNLEPVKQHHRYNDRVLIGFGRIIKLKKGEKLGIQAYVHHNSSVRVDESVTQVVPAVTTNPYPYANNSVPVVRSFSNDVNYRYSSQLAAALNTALFFGRNKVTLKSFFVSQFNNTYIDRAVISRPDEDSLSQKGINYQPQQRIYFNTRLAGEHALAGNGSFKLNWQASYTFVSQRNADERNFLLRADSVGNNTFELARPSAASQSSVDNKLPNSGRQWRDYRDHNFWGGVDIQTPFSVGQHTQIISGGVAVQTKYRVFYGDLFHVQGTGYYAMGGLLAPERYYPGGVSVTNYFERVVFSGGTINPDAITAAHRSGYTGSANIGSAFISLNSSVTKKLRINLGLRLESGSQLVSTSQYNYFEGYKNPQLGTLDENDRVAANDILPSVHISYQVFEKLLFHASYFRTVNRPQLEELARYRYHDAASFAVKTGNPLLQNSIIDNIDAGIRFYSGPGTELSLNGFYRQIDRPLEYNASVYATTGGTLLLTPHNMPAATISGLSASFRFSPASFSAASWLSGISFYGSGTLQHSEVRAGPLRSLSTPSVPEHSLSQTPDYFFSGGLILAYGHLPSVNIVYYMSDDYLSAVGSGDPVKLQNGNTITVMPDLRIKRRDQLDLQLSKKFFRAKFQLIAGVTNLLNNRYIEYQDLNGNGKFDEPLAVNARAGRAGGFYQTGTDNTLYNNQPQRTYYVSLSYLFNGTNKK